MSAEQAPWRRQSSQLSGGGNTPSPGPPSEGNGVTANNSAPTFAAPPPPPPPPPPPTSGPLPSVRLSSEIPDSRKGGGYEPPAAIQNAMLTKDKKPFTYTPGGLDLSQIRSPRMQRRITRNANAEGVGDHPQQAASVAKTSPLAQPPPQGPLPPSAMAAMQPQMAVPVFPSGGVPQLHHVPTPPGSHSAPAPPPPPPPSSGPTFVEQPSVPQPPISNAVPKITPSVIRPVQSPAPYVEPSIPSPPIIKAQVVPTPTIIHNEPGSIYVPPVTSRAQVGSLYIPPITNNTQQETMTSNQRQQTPHTASPMSPPSSASPMSPLPTLNKAPTPWMSQHQRQQQQQQQQNVPPWANREEPQQQQQPMGATRIIPIQVEGRNDQVQPPQAHHQAPMPVPQYQPPQPASNQAQTRIIPIQIEGSTTVTNNAPKQQSSSQQQQRMPVYVHNKFNAPTSPQTQQTPPSPAPYNHNVGNDSQSDPRQYQHQQSWGPPGGNGAPIQSRSFRVLQKITDTDHSEGESDVPAQEYGPPNSGGGQWNNPGIPVQQMRKLQLSEDDRALMNKFRAQDDGAPQPYIPPSEQQAPEPRKYTGGAIPSRSFRMLQAMTAPENCATVSSSDGRETPASFSHQGYDENSGGPWAHYDPSYWGPEAWWGCYPSEMPENGEQYWDPFSAMYAYMAEVNAAYGFPPMPYHPMYAAHQYPPPPPPPQRTPRYSHNSDSDECSGYSSTDEMAYYGANFARMVPMMGARMPLYSNPPTPATPSIVVTNEGSPSKAKATSKCSDKEPHTSNDSKVEESEINMSRSPSSIDLDAYETAESEKSSDDDEAITDSDTEVEEDKENGTSNEGMKSGSGGQLQSARSVSDINVYKNTSGSDVQDSETNDEETEDDDDDEDDEDEEDNEREHYADGDVCIPHQLSVIYEESEQSDAESTRRPGHNGRCPTRTSSSMTTSEDGDSSTTLDNADDESDEDYDIVDSESSTVTVRLPLKLKFSRSENDEEVTTVIVGDSQVKRQEIIEESIVPATNEEHKNLEKQLEEIKDKQIEEIKEKQEEGEEEEEEEEEASKPKTKPEQEAMIVVDNEMKDEGGDVSTDVSVTLCFPSKSNPSKRVEQWRRDASQFAGSNPTSTEQTGQNAKAGKGTAKTNARVANETSQHTASDDADVYETAESDSDVSVCLSLPLRKPSHKGSISSPPGFESINNISEEDDEEDGKASSHCEDDSSSTTSIQTVRMASGSLGRSSGSEIETPTIADDGDDVQSSKSNSSITKNQPESISVESSSEKKGNNGKSKYKHEVESDDNEDSSRNDKVSISSQSCNKTKQENKEGKTDTISNVTNDEEEDDDDEEEDDDDDDDDSDESDDSQDGKEPDLIQKIYELCKESNVEAQKVAQHQNSDSSKNKELDTNTEHEKIKGDGSQEVENIRRRQNSKSQEESEEDDSGVTSDMSRQISDADTESEAGRSERSRLVQCQRASTHSRLFKLLQDECGKSDDEDEDDDEKFTDNQNVPKGNESMKSRREHLTLPLNTNGSDPDSLSSSSGVTSPASPTVTDRLVKELVQSLLQRKKGRRLKKLPLAKLHAAALRILQEDMDPYDTGSSEDSTGNHVYLSPVHRRASKNMHHSNNTNNTANYPLPPQQMMYGANYYDYCDYYDSWANAASYYGTDTCGAFEYDIMPSRAFKLLSEHAQPGGFSSGVINGLWAKCPRIASSKNLPKDLSTATETEADDVDKTESNSSSCPLPPPESAQASARAT